MNCSSVLSTFAGQEPDDLRSVVQDPPEGVVLPELIWYDEKDLTLDRWVERSGNQLHTARELAAARTHDERVRLLGGMLRVIGFDTLAYVMLQVIKGRVLRAFLPKNYVPPQYRGHYFRERYFEVDPRVVIGSAHNPPVVWDLMQLNEACRRNDEYARANRFLQEMDADGMRSGIMFSMPVPLSNLQVLISFTSVNPRRGWIDNGTTLGQALALGLSIHQLASGYTRTIARQSSAIDPSEMQRRILLCLASGLSDKEIAARLHTSAHNVDYHLRLLRKACDVTNRTQLAYMAGRLGLV